MKLLHFFTYSLIIVTFFFACNEDLLEMEDITAEKTVENVNAVKPESIEDGITVTWEVTDYENAVGYKVLHEISNIPGEGSEDFSEIIIIDNISTNTLTVEATAGTHTFEIYIFDSEGNSSLSTTTSVEIKLLDITSELRLAGLEAIRQGDSIKVSFDIPDYKYLKGYKIIDATSSFELVAEDKTVNEYYIPTYPGAHDIKVFAMDVEDNLSTEAVTSIHITDVYVLGSLSGTNIRYWKNGVGIEVEGGSRGIFVVGNDVYTAGTSSDLSTNNSVATYWKNGVSFPLTDGSTQGRAYSIQVENDIVYVLGKERDPVTTNYVIKCWTNGVATNLTDGSNDAQVYINSLAVENGNVYAAGVEEDLITGNNLLKYWVNGEEFVLSDGTEQIHDGFIAVENGNVYIAGSFYYLDAVLNEFQFSIKYWVNGNVHIIPVEVNTEIGTYGISVNNGNLCIPMQDNDLISDVDTYRYFINGIDQGVLETGTLRWKITSCASNAGDFYVCGEERNESTGLDMVTYWKNGEKVQLTDGTISASAENIFVVD